MGGILDGIVGRLRGFNRARLRRRHKDNYRSGIRQVDYQSWVSMYDSINESTRSSLMGRVRQLDSGCEIGLVVSVCDPKIDWLSAVLESVRGQLYPRWKLCIVEKGSCSRVVRDYLGAMCSVDPRIQFVSRENSDSLFSCAADSSHLADMPYVGFLTCGDVLREHALLFMAEALEKFPEAALVYSDEDRLLPDGSRSEPHFKPDWNPEMLLAFNYIGRLALFRCEDVRACGGIRLGTEGVEIYDLTLRFTRNVSAKRIVHIPHILCHARLCEPGVLRTCDIGGLCEDSVRVPAVKDHLSALGVDADVVLDDDGRVQLVWKRTGPEPLVSIIIPTRNGVDILKLCVDSLLDRMTYGNVEIIVVDNGSDDPLALKYLDSLRSMNRFKVIRDDGPFNYSAINNRAVAQSSGEYIVLLNNDVEVITPGWLEDMLGMASLPGVGVVGACLWYGDKTLQHGGLILGIGDIAGYSHKHFDATEKGYMGRLRMIQATSAVTAACLLVKRSLFDHVGGLNEVELKVAFNDVDFCLKVLEAGYRVVWTPNAQLFHHESVSRGSDASPEKRARAEAESAAMKRRWGDVLKSDRMYSPNLTLERENFGLAFPPRVSLQNKWFES
jgi:O-antigen biosynthesis protein